MVQFDPEAMSKPHNGKDTQKDGMSFPNPASSRQSWLTRWFKLVPVRLVHSLVLLAVSILPFDVLANSTPAKPADATPAKMKPHDPQRYDIAVIIDNRRNAHRTAARQDVEALSRMLDEHMLVENVIRLERPTYEVICDIFGGCPDTREAANPWPPLIWQITREGQSRLFVYYLGRGRVEGLARQLPFRRHKDSALGDDKFYNVGWLHQQLKDAQPKSGMIIMEAGFAPRTLPCASEDPLLFDSNLLTVRQNYAEFMRGRSLPEGLSELTATIPVQAAHCDRYDLVLEDVEQPLFTKFLLKGIAEGSADKPPFGDEDDLIDLGELAAYTEDSVKRAVRFQWGRLQNVWPIGPLSLPVASVDARPPSRAQEKDPASKPAEKPAEKPAKKTTPPEGADPNRCRDNPDAAGCHPCVVDPEGDACQKRCAENADDELCTPLSVGASRGNRDPCFGLPVSEDCPCRWGDARTACSGNWCRWTSTRTAGGGRALVGSLRGDPNDLCGWTEIDEDQVERGPIETLITPIFWRMARPLVREGVSCLLDCRAVTPVSAGTGQPELSTEVGLEPQAGDEANPASESSAPAEKAAEDTPTAKPMPPVEFPSANPPPSKPEPSTEAGLEPPAGDEANPASESSAPAEKAAENAPSVKPMPLVEPQLANPPPSKPASPVVETANEVKPAPTEEPFEPTVSQVRWLQSALTVGNHNPGPIDGSLGWLTKEALHSWRRQNATITVNDGLTEAAIDELTKAEFRQIVKEFGELFDQVQPKAPLY